MHDGMPCDPIQGQGHGASEVPKIALFEIYLNRHLWWGLANDWVIFFIFVRLFVSCDLELGGVPAVSPSTKSFSDFSEIWYV